MNTVETFPGTCAGLAPGQEEPEHALDTELFLRFPDGVCPILYSAEGEYEKRFYARYLSDIQFLLNQNLSAWADWRSKLEEEDSGPVLEFDPEWFSFLLPAKEFTRMELFAWYWLWVDGDRGFSISRYALEELREAFLAAREFGHIAAELYRVTAEINRHLDVGSPREGFGKYLLDEDTQDDFHSVCHGQRIWFLDLLVDYEPLVQNSLNHGRDPEFSVWLYRVAGEKHLKNVAGQVCAVYRKGCWKVDSSARRDFSTNAILSDCDSRATLVKG